MSDTTHPDNGQLALQTLSQQLAELRAQASGHHSTTTIDAPRTKLLVVSEETQDLIPTILGQYFYFPASDSDNDVVFPNDLHFPKNPNQQYMYTCCNFYKSGRKRWCATRWGQIRGKTWDEWTMEQGNQEQVYWKNGVLIKT